MTQPLTFAAANQQLLSTLCAGFGIESSATGGGNGTSSGGVGAAPGRVSAAPPKFETQEGSIMATGSVQYVFLSVGVSLVTGQSLLSSTLPYFQTLIVKSLLSFSSPIWSARVLRHATLILFLSCF
jgi:hypothetical protein